MPSRRAGDARERVDKPPVDKGTPAERLAEARNVADEAARRQARYAAWLAERHVSD